MHSMLAADDDNDDDDNDVVGDPVTVCLASRLSLRAATC